MCKANCTLSKLQYSGYVAENFYTYFRNLEKSLDFSSVCTV